MKKINKHKKNFEEVKPKVYTPKQIINNLTKFFEDGFKENYLNELNITSEELLECSKMFEILLQKDFEEEYEYDGNYLITKDKTQFKKHIQTLCCGIHTDEYKLKSGETVYFVFDYGH